MIPKRLFSNWQFCFRQILLLIFIKNVYSSGLVNLNLTRLTNPANVDYLGECCNSNETGKNCTESCNTFMRICVTHVSRFQSYFTLNLRIDLNTPCSFGLIITDVIEDGDLFEEINRSLKFDFPWPGKLLFIFETWHSPNGSNPVDGAVKDGRLLARYVNQHRLSPKDQWISANLSSDTDSSLSYNFRVLCTPGYTGKKCKEKCPSSNDTGSTFTCSQTGTKVCREGWNGDRCDRPICLPGCHPTQGYCNKPNECECRIGWSGDTCEECIPMFGCLHGFCNRTLECNCLTGWDGFFCSEPRCKDGCHPTRGYCEHPSECKCKVGWKGEFCDECRRLPGCIHGYCEKPLDCICEEGWTGLFCHIPICHPDCDKFHGYCNKPKECRCRVGWQGKNCDQCFPYPGCGNGSCEKPWECNCLPGWGGPLCDRQENYCEAMKPCINNGTCIDQLDQKDGYLCLCPENHTGKNCETLPTEDDINL